MDETIGFILSLRQIIKKDKLNSMDYGGRIRQHFSMPVAISIHYFALTLFIGLVLSFLPFSLAGVQGYWKWAPIIHEYLKGDLAFQWSEFFFGGQDLFKTYGHLPFWKLGRLWNLNFIQVENLTVFIFFIFSLYFAHSIYSFKRRSFGILDFWLLSVLTFTYPLTMNLIFRGELQLLFVQVFWMAILLFIINKTIFSFIAGVFSIWFAISFCGWEILSFWQVIPNLVFLVLIIRVISVQDWDLELRSYILPVLTGLLTITFIRTEILVPAVLLILVLIKAKSSFWKQSLILSILVYSGLSLIPKISLLRMLQSDFVESRLLLSRMLKHADSETIKNEIFHYEGQGQEQINATAKMMGIRTLEGFGRAPESLIKKLGSSGLALNHSESSLFLKLSSKQEEKMARSVGITYIIRADEYIINKAVNEPKEKNDFRILEKI